MANIILPKYKELSVENKMLVKGEWKVEIVHANGEVSQPLGDKMRPNLIQDTGIRFLVGHDRSGYSFDGTNAGLRQPRGIPDVISHAIYSSSAANPTATNYRGNMLGTDGGWTSRNSTNTCSRVDISDGCTYTKVWDFNAVQTGQHTVREIAVGCRGASGGDNVPVFNESGYGRPTGFLLFSRFVLPSNIIIDTYQFLRLTYTLQVSIPATVTPIDVPSIVSGSFSTLGKIKCVGRFRDILGDMNANGSQIQQLYSQIGFTQFPWIRPWALIPNTESNLNYPGAALMSSDDEFGNGALNINEYAPNTILPNTIGTSKSATKMYTHIDIGGSVTNDAYTAGSNSASKSAAIFFPATVPNISRWIGGVFFIPTLPSYNGSPLVSDPFSIGLDVNSRGVVHGWLYNFYDEFGVVRAQFKDINFALRFNYTQTVTR